MVGQVIWMGWSTSASSFKQQMTLYSFRLIAPPECVNSLRQIDQEFSVVFLCWFTLLHLRSRKAVDMWTEYCPHIHSLGYEDGSSGFAAIFGGLIQTAGGSG